MALPVFDAHLMILLGTVLLAGIAKGLSGFGSGMIVAPVAGALYGPPAALVIAVIIDSLPTIPLAIAAMRIARWAEVLIVALGVGLFMPVGVFLLTNGDPTTLRWIIAAAILSCVAVLWSGYRYRGPRGPLTSLSVGSVAGVLSGIASIPGPPVIAYWLASGLPAAVVRANLISLFFVSEFISIANLWVADLFTYDIVTISLVASIPYIMGLTIGARLFRSASEARYKQITFLLIVLAAMLSLPIFDGWAGSD